MSPGNVFLHAPRLRQMAETQHTESFSCKTALGPVAANYCNMIQMISLHLFCVWVCVQCCSNIIIRRPLAAAQRHRHQGSLIQKSSRWEGFLFFRHPFWIFSCEIKWFLRCLKPLLFIEWQNSWGKKGAEQNASENLRYGRGPQPFVCSVVTVNNSNVAKKNKATLDI